MGQNDLKSKYFQRIKKALNKRMFLDLLLMLLPIFLLVLIFFLTIITYGMSLLLVYFILPMFYALDQRVRSDLNGIGNPRESFLSGYKEFFQSNKGGIFGAFFTIIRALGIFLLCALIVGFFMPNIVNCFPDAKPVFNELVGKFTKANTPRLEMVEFMLENLFHLTRPLTIYFGVVTFLPLFYIIFFGVDENLTYHYLSGILLPDLDLNISSSQSRSVAKSFTKDFTGYRLQETIKVNFPLYLLFAMLYAVCLWGCSYISVYHTSNVSFVVLIAPASSLVFGSYINHFCLINEYAILEENKEVLLDSLPLAMKTSIYQTFHAKEYVHGKESEIRGCFIPEKNISSTKEKRTESPHGGVFDFSQNEGER